MEIVVLCIAVIALILSLLVYYRARDHNNLRTMERALKQKLRRLSILAQQATEDVAARVRTRYDRHLRMIAYLQSRVAALKEEALEEIRENLGDITQELERLAERARRELKDFKAGLDFTRLEMEVGLRLALDDAKAHLKLIEAKRELVLARMAALRNDLVEAEARMEAALRLIDEASSLAVGYHENLVALQQQARVMLAAIGKRADAMCAAVEGILERCDQLLQEISAPHAGAKNAA